MFGGELKCYLLQGIKRGKFLFFRISFDFLGNFDSISWDCFSIRLFTVIVSSRGVGMYDNLLQHFFFSFLPSFRMYQYNKR